MQITSSTAKKTHKRERWGQKTDGCGQRSDSELWFQAVRWAPASSSSICRATQAQSTPCFTQLSLFLYRDLEFAAVKCYCTCTALQTEHKRLTAAQENTLIFWHMLWLSVTCTLELSFHMNSWKKPPKFMEISPRVQSQARKPTRAAEQPSCSWGTGEHGGECAVLTGGAAEGHWG